MGPRAWAQSGKIAVFVDNGQISGALGAKAIFARGGATGTSIGNVHMLCVDISICAYNMCVLSILIVSSESLCSKSPVFFLHY
jgi:hypothetical protein